LKTSSKKKRLLCPICHRIFWRYKSALKINKAKSSCCSKECAHKLKSVDYRRRLATNPVWVKNVSEGTKKAMRRPKTRNKHLAGLKRALKKHGVNFKGGQNQEPVAFVKSLAEVLLPIGFIQEHRVFWSKGRWYLLDFAYVQEKIAVECDGPKHRAQKQKQYDKIRNTRLKKLGWKVVHVPHL